MRVLRQRVLLSYFAALGYEITVEESSAVGRLDMAVRAGGHVYLFEFKVVEQAGPGAALAQLRERDYAAKYRGGGKSIHLIGVEFSRKTRTLTALRPRTPDRECSAEVGSIAGMDLLAEMLAELQA